MKRSVVSLRRKSAARGKSWRDSKLKQNWLPKREKKKNHD